MSRSIPLLFGLILILISCKEKKEVSSGNVDSVNTIVKRESASNEMLLYPRHEIKYDSVIKRGQLPITFDTSTIRFHCHDTIIGYRINPVTKKVARLCAKKDNKYVTTGLLLNDDEIKWSKAFGAPNEFIGEYLFADVYRGGDLGGTITKNKFRLGNNRFEFVDSIPGGSYSEGAGTWDWLITHQGKPAGIIFHGGDLWAVDGDTHRLLITPGESGEDPALTHLIDLQRGDTIFSLPVNGTRPWHQLRYHLTDDRILFSGQTLPRLCYLQMFDLKGQLLWEAETDYLDKIMIDPLNDLIIGSGYYFPGKDNTQIYFTVAFDQRTGQMRWSFPTSKVYNERQNLTNGLMVSNLFIINDDLYGMIAGKAGEHVNEYTLNHSNKLILFDKDGLICQTIELSSAKQNYDVIVKGKNEFEIVSNTETRRFKISTP